ASVNLMRRLGHALVEIHGQHDERALVDTDSHRDLLDDWAGITHLAGEVAAAHRRWRAAEEEQRAFSERVAAAARESEYLRASLDELVRLDPEEGEEIRLAD